jgi:hypothetical protein
VATSGTTTSTNFRPHEAQDCADADHLGVVFVHGVGFQNRGETLLSWSDRLIRMLGARYGDADDPVDRVHRSEIDLDGSEPSSIELRIPGVDGGRPQHWLLAEAFWAASIQPPSVPTMLRWLGARGAAALAAVGPARAFRNSVYLTGVVIGALVLYAAVRSLTAIVPIAALRNALVAPLDRLLTGWSGDMQVLVFDAAQSANIRTRVFETITGVADAGFERVAVVAHSGGAVAGYMTLTDDALWQPTASRPTLPQLVTLITLGQGLNIAWRLCGVGDGEDCSNAVASGRRLTADPRRNHGDLRWYDFFSEGDTVSETRLRPPACLEATVPGDGDRHLVENVPSNPHGTYWDNDEEFVLPVVRRLEASAGVPVDGDVPTPFPAPDSSRLARRMLRIGMFSLTRRVLFSALAAAIVGGALLGGARMDDLGAALAEIVSAIPLIGLLAGPRDWIAEATTGAWWWEALRGVGTLVLSLLLVLVAFFPLSRLGPDRLAVQVAGEPLQRRLIRAVDGAAAALPLAAVAAWVVLTLRSDANAAPAWAVIAALVLAGIGFALALLRLRSGWDAPLLEELESAARSGVGVMAIVGLLAIVGVGTLLAIVGDAGYGGTTLGAATLGAVVVYVLYRLLGGVANWRWQAWDEQEREQFRQTLEPGRVRVGDRPWGRRVDLVVIGFACVAAVVLAAAIGAPIIGTAAAFAAGGVVLLIVVIIWMIGAGQDAANSRVEPGEVTPLPTSAA